MYIFICDLLLAIVYRHNNFRAQITGIKNIDCRKKIKSMYHILQRVTVAIVDGKKIESFLQIFTLKPGINTFSLIQTI